MLNPYEHSRGADSPTHEMAIWTLDGRRLTKDTVCGLVRFHGPASLRKTRTINLNFKVAILRVTEFDKAIFGDCSEIAFGVSA
jgi:hypothetical protein